MKPRNNNEREVEQLRHSLITRQSDLDWIEKCHKVGNTEYFAVYERKGDWQVIRMFMYRSYSKKNEVFHEPLQYWIKADGSHVIVCKNRQCLGNCYIDAWCVGSEMCIRKCEGSRDVRGLWADHLRIHSLIPELKRMGFKANNPMVKNLRNYYLVHSLLTNNRVETFFKLNQKWLTMKFYWYDTLTETLWQAIRVALRHGYHWDSFNEVNDWVDYVNDLERLGLDTRNPHYICPIDVNNAHKKYFKRIQKLDEMRQEELRREWEENRRKREEVYEETYKENRKMFFGMIFSDGEINIQIIQSVADMIEEGKAMHHCVGGYYDKMDSLILSAKIDGKRIETIEVSLKSFEVVQSRGVCNKDTEYHERIVKLMYDNMNEIKKRYLKAA